MSTGKGDRSKRDKVKGRKRSGASSVVTTDPCSDEVMVERVISSCSSSDFDDVELEKRFKPGSPEFLRAMAALAEKEGAGSVGPAIAAVKERVARPGRKSVSAPVDNDWMAKLKQITSGLMDVVFGKVDGDLPRKVLDQSAQFELLLMRLVAENERLKGRLEVFESGAHAVAAAPLPVPLAPAVRATPATVPVVPAVAAPVVKPVETWSVVVRGKGGASSKEVVQKVEKEVGPTLGVRVHGIRPMRDGGAVIRTPSVAEREKIAANSKFAEVGLEVAVNDKLGPRVVVQRVHAEISVDDFMGDLYEMNLRGICTDEVFKKSVRLVSSPWKVEPDVNVNVVLECSGRVADKLCAEGVYIKWFRFAARLQDAVPACHRCLSFDHRVRECRMTQDVCRHCGLTGHIAWRCPNPMRCRNCAFKGFQADHMMMSPACPVYAALTARANLRH